jgi:hypothetical protein
MTTVELRRSIIADLDQMSLEMMESVSHYVKRLRRRASSTHQVATNEAVPDIVLSLLGAGEPVAEDDLNAREAYNQYLEEKHK